MIEGSQIIFSGSVWTQLLTALVVGLLIAFALQILLTSLGVAVGMSVLAVRAGADRSQAFPADELEAVSPSETETAIEPESKPAESAAQLGFWAGFSVLLTVDIVLFAACFLAARFSQAQSPLTGAIEGIVIWSAYLLVLIWLSSTAVSSVVGSLLGITMGGFRQIMRPIGAMFSSSEAAAATASEVRETVRQEMQSAFNPEQLQSLIRAELRTELQQSAAISGEPYSENSFAEKSDRIIRPALSDETATLQQLAHFLQDTAAEQLTSKQVDRYLRQLLESSQISSSERTQTDIDRSAVMYLLMQREDLSDKQREKIIKRIEKTWRKFRQSIEETDESHLETDQARQYLRAQELTATVLQTLAAQIPNFPLNEAEIDRAVQQVPELLHQAGKQLPTGASLAMLTVALSKGKDLLPEGIDLQSMKQTLDQAIEQSGMSDLNHALVEQVDQLRDQSLHQIEQVQQTVQQQVDRLKSETSQQLQATQRTATIAAWWLFLTISTGAISAAVAGAVANLI